MRSVDNGLKKLVDDKYLTDDYYFDEKEAINFKKFAEKLWLPEGLPGQLIVLMAFQLKIAIEILAIKRVKDGTRRFREVFITMPRKNAKSFLVRSEERRVGKVYISVVVLACVMMIG